MQFRIDTLWFRRLFSWIAGQKREQWKKELMRCFVLQSLHAAGWNLSAAAHRGAQGFRGDQVQIFIIRDFIQVISVLQQLPAQVWMNLCWRISRWTIQLCITVWVQRDERIFSSLAQCRVSPVELYCLWFVSGLLKHSSAGAQSSLLQRSSGWISVFLQSGVESRGFGHDVGPSFLHLSNPIICCRMQIADLRPLSRGWRLALGQKSSLLPALHHGASTKLKSEFKPEIIS